MPKHRPHTRLKALRKETGLTQLQLATKAAISYPYLLAVETGQRQLSLPLAEAVACATGVGPLWLTGKIGSARTPLTPDGKRLTRQDFLSSFGDGSAVAHVPSTNGTTTKIQHQCRELTALMRVARRKGRFPVAAYFFSKMISETANNLKLEKLFKDELTRLRKGTTLAVQPLGLQRAIALDD